MAQVKDTDVILVHGLRSPIGKLCGSLSELEAHEIGGQVLTALFDRLKGHGLDPTPNLSQVVIGQVITAGGGQNPARRTAFQAGVPMSVPSYNVNMVCGSGLLSVGLCFDSLHQRNASSEAWCIAGGQESMSRAPHLIPGARANCKRGGVPMYGDVTMLDAIKYDGLTDAFGNGLMGDTAENVAHNYGLDKDAQDEFAIWSHTKYHAAKEFIQQEIVPIKTKKSPEPVLLDESPRPLDKLEAIKKSPCVFTRKDSGERTVTGGNACPLNDGAAMVALTNGYTFSKNNMGSLKKELCLCKIVGWERVGIDPSVMGLGPINAIKALIDRINWSLDQVDVFEINEAFASQSLAVLSDLRIDTAKVNIGGGSIAIGHPLGASGTRILVTLMHRITEESRKQNRPIQGVAALCIGGGMGIAMAIETIR